jgi:hypothetical protein
LASTGLLDKGWTTDKVGVDDTAGNPDGVGVDGIPCACTETTKAIIRLAKSTEISSPYMIFLLMGFLLVKWPQVNHHFFIVIFSDKN